MRNALLGKGALWRSAGQAACGRPLVMRDFQTGNLPISIQQRRYLCIQPVRHHVQEQVHSKSSITNVVSRPFIRRCTFVRNFHSSEHTNRLSFTAERHIILSLTTSSPTFPYHHSIITKASGSWRRPLEHRQIRVYVNDANKPGSGPPVTGQGNSPSGKTIPPAPKYEPPKPPTDHESSDYSYLRDHLPSIPHIHRPSKEELLAAASGFFSRLRVRFKWASIRSMRPFNNDEIGAFISLIAFGHVIWLFIGTTTFISLAIWAINSIFAQETLARWVGSYLTQASGLQVVFESAVVPKWGDGVISFRNVFVSRRPGLGQGNVSKGSPETAAAARAAAEEADKSSDVQPAASSVNQNYTQFDVTIDTVNVTLSFTKWWNSKGLLKDVEVKGVRGVVDRTHVHHIKGIDPRSYKHEHHLGDFEIENFKLEDLLVTLHQPEGFRPFSVSIYTCELPRLRKQWLFYDFLSASHCSGAYDDSQFNIHPRQMHGHVGLFVDEAVRASGENPWRQHNRLRIDGLNIDHLNAGVEGPFGWINRGNVDIVADIMFPADPDESISKVVSEMYGKMEESITSRLQIRVGDNTQSAIHNEGSQIVHLDASNKGKIAPSITFHREEAEDRRCIVMDLRVRINDIRASPPVFPKDISYIDNALIRPIVAFLNSRPNWVPINGRLVKRVGDFDGSWTLFDSGLMDEVSEELYNSCVRDLQDSEARARRFRKVGIWSLQLFAQALFIGLVGNIS